MNYYFDDDGPCFHIAHIAVYNVDSNIVYSTNFFFNCPFVSRRKYLKGGTRTGLALKIARKTFFRSRRERKACIVMTDGRSGDGVVKQARLLRNIGFQMIAVGVGRLYSVSQLMQIAQNKKHVFTARFRTLNSMLSAIKKKICNGTFFTIMMKLRLIRNSGFRL